MKEEIFMQTAIDEAVLSIEENGLPIGSVLILDGKIIGRGRNQRIQKKSVILHAEMDAIENVGRLEPEEYARSVIYSTLSPCLMCSGTIVFLGIKKVITIDHNQEIGAEGFLKSQGIELIKLNMPDNKDILEALFKQEDFF